MLTRSFVSRTSFLAPLLMVLVVSEAQAQTSSLTFVGQNPTVVYQAKIIDNVLQMDTSSVVAHMKAMNNPSEVVISSNGTFVYHAYFPGPDAPAGEPHDFLGGLSVLSNGNLRYSTNPVVVDSTTGPLGTTITAAYVEGQLFQLNGQWYTVMTYVNSQGYPTQGSNGVVHHVSMEVGQIVMVMNYF